MVLQMVSVLIPCDVKMQILCAPVASVSAIVGSEISAVTVLKVYALQKLHLRFLSLDFNKNHNAHYSFSMNGVDCTCHL